MALGVSFAIFSTIVDLPVPWFPAMTTGFPVLERIVLRIAFATAGRSTNLGRSGTATGWKAG